jgi:protein O-mannosyl-transferase
VVKFSAFETARRGRPRGFTFYLTRMARKQTRTAAESAKEPRKWLLLALGLPLLFSAIVYTPAMNGEFTNWDDTLLVTENPRIRSLAPSAIATMLTPVPGRTYQPVRELSYALDYALWELNPLPYHLQNVFLHGLAAGLLVLALARLLGTLRPKSGVRENQAAALMTGLLFAVHPVNVESVAWISSRKYGLLAVFTALALLAFANSATARHADSAKFGPWRALMIVSVVLACLSSPFGVALVPALLLLDWACRDGSPLEDAKSAILGNRGLVFLGAVAMVFFAWLLVLSKAPGADSEEVVKTGGGLIATGVTMLGVLVEYGLNFVWPSGLNNYYDVRIGSESALKALPGLLAFAGILYWAWKRVGQGDRVAAVCVGWFILWWLPVSNIIPISTRMADRYVYLPGIALFLGVVVLLQKRGNTMIAGGVLLAFAAVAMQRCRVWKNSESLWRDSLETRPASFTAHNNLGLALQARGAFEEAMSEYLAALEARPNHSVALNNLGYCLIESRRPAEAIPHLRASVAKRPNYGDALNNLATALSKVGKKKDVLPIIRKAVDLDPTRADRHYNLGNTLLALGQPQKAISAFDKALELEPRMAQVYNNLAVANDQLGKREEAADAFRNSFRLEPRVSTAMNLALLLAREKRFAEAVAAAEQARAIATTEELPMIEQRLAEYRQGL